MEVLIQMYDVFLQYNSYEALNDFCKKIPVDTVSRAIYKVNTRR